MNNFGQHPMEDAIAHITTALDAETKRCLDTQGHLDRANAEFAEFVSTAAHNLRESLRDVTAFGQLLAETHAGRLDSDGAAYLDRIQRGAAKMESLLADVVDYWSAGADHPESANTDMEAVFSQALLTSAKWIKERRAVVTHDPLPRVSGDFDLLAKVLHHLIRNAIEYCGKPSPCVHVSSKRVGGECVIMVQDNGPGIDPAFQGRLFRPFRRLHGREFPGNGLGLAFCKKTIEGQGGRIWIASTPGPGSTLCFTLLTAD